MNYEPLEIVVLTFIFIGVMFRLDIVSQIFKSCDVDYKENEPPLPDIPARLWKALSAGSPKPGRMIGLLDMLVGTFAFWTGAFVLVAAWFGFKVASKWEAWSNVVQVPDHIDGLDQIEYLRYRRLWGERIMTRFLVGTGTNVLLGVLAGQLARYIIL